MAKTLFLFTGLTPNIDGHPYFNIKVFDNYLNYLKAHYTYVEISDDNYRINANIIKITTANLTNKLFTYAVETDGNGWHRCFFVDAITEQSNMLYMELSIDYWGSYYLASNIDYLHVTRCNRRIGVGVYDEIKIAGQEETGSPDIVYYGNDSNHNFITNLYNVTLVISLSYNTIQAVFTDEHTTTTALFAITLQELFAKYQSEDATKIAGKTIFEIIEDFVGGIVGTAGNIGTLDAVINSAYLVLTDYISTSSNYIEVKTKSILLNDTIETQVFKINYGIVSNAYTIDNTKYDIDYEYIAGAPLSNGLKLARLTNKQLRFSIVCEALQDRLNIYARQGENQTDITSNFVFDITSNTIYTTNLRKIADSITQAGNIYKGMTKAYEKSGASGAGITGLTSIASMVSGFNVTKDVKGNGDAYSTFGFISSKAYLPSIVVKYPIALTKYKSANNEQQHARYFGAQFDEVIEDINSIFEFEFLGSATYDETYIVANEIRILNLPSIARRAIEQAFASGVELLDYEGTASD